MCKSLRVLNRKKNCKYEVLMRDQTSVSTGIPNPQAAYW